jgi:hypothetical protein
VWYCLSLAAALPSWISSPRLQSQAYFIHAGAKTAAKLQFALFANFRMLAMDVPAPVSCTVSVLFRHRFQRAVAGMTLHAMFAPILSLHFHQLVMVLLPATVVGIIVPSAHIDRRFGTAAAD